MNKKCVILGVTGQDGSLLAKYLLDKNYEIFGVVRRTSSPTNWRWNELGIRDHDNFHIISGDITDQSSIDRIIAEYKPDEIYNLAADSFVGSSWNLAESVLNTTGVGAFRVFEAVRKYIPNAKIYQAGSSEQFGNNIDDDWLDEVSPMNPVSPYGAAKLLAYNMAQVYKQSYNMFISCGILFNHCGPYRGEEFVTRKISKGVALIKHGLLDHISLGNINSKRDEGSAEEYVEAIWLMLQQEKPDNFVIATGKSYSVYDFVKQALISAGIEPTLNKYIRIDEKLIRPNELHCLCGGAFKAKRILGWYPKKTFNDIVKDMVEHDIERLQK